MPPTRRQLLQALGWSGVAGLAGCAEQSPETTDPDPTETTPTPTQGFGIEAGPTIDVQPVASGLVSPTHLAIAPGTGDRYVVDQVGTVHRLGPDGLADDPVLDLRERVVVSPERGLLGMAVHPDFPETSRVYLRYSRPSPPDAPPDQTHVEILAEFRMTTDGTAILPDSERELFAVPQPTIFHQSGSIAFGPDGYLYVAFGESNQQMLAQDVETNFKGALLRIDVDTQPEESPYGIPSDNPHVDGPGRPEYFAWGFRNPWGLSFHEGTLLLADVGPYGFEEVNRVAKGRNYGWPYRLGYGCHGDRTSTPGAKDCGADLSAVPGGAFVDPVTGFPRTHNEDPVGTAVIGGHVYDLDAIAALTGQYVFANYTTELDRPDGRIFAARRTDRTPWPLSELVVANGIDGRINRVIQAVGRDRQGRLYLLTTGVPDTNNRFEYSEGEVFRIVAAGTADGDIPPAPEVDEE